MSAVITSVSPISPDVSIIRGHWMIVNGTGFQANTTPTIFIRDSSGSFPGLRVSRSGLVTDGDGNLRAPIRFPNFGTTIGNGEKYYITVIAGFAATATIIPGG